MSRRPVRESAAPAMRPGTTIPPAGTTIPPSCGDATPPAEDAPTGVRRVADPARTGRVHKDRAAGPGVPGPVIVDGPGASGVSGANGPLRGLVTVSGRLVLAAPRGRGIPSIDVVEFVAPCPACGTDVPWIEEREETRLRIIIECPCDR